MTNHASTDVASAEIGDSSNHGFKVSGESRYYGTVSPRWFFTEEALNDATALPVSCGLGCLDSCGVCQSPCRREAEEMAFQAGFESGIDAAEERSPERVRSRSLVFEAAIFAVLGAIFFGGIGFFLGMQYVLQCVAGTGTGGSL